MLNVLYLPHKVVLFFIQWRSLTPHKLLGALDALKESLLTNVHEMRGPKNFLSSEDWRKVEFSRPSP